MDPSTHGEVYGKFGSIKLEGCVSTIEIYSAACGAYVVSAFNTCICGVPRSSRSKSPRRQVSSGRCLAVGSSVIDIPCWTSSSSPYLSLAESLSITGRIAGVSFLIAGFIAFSGKVLTQLKASNLWVLTF